MSSIVLTAESAVATQNAAFGLRQLGTCFVANSDRCDGFRGPVPDPSLTRDQAAIYDAAMQTQMQIADVTAVLTRNIEALASAVTKGTNIIALSRKILYRIDRLERSILTMIATLTTFKLGPAPTHTACAPAPIPAPCPIPLPRPMPKGWNRAAHAICVWDPQQDADQEMTFLAAEVSNTTPLADPPTGSAAAALRTVAETASTTLLTPHH
ncbi:hypothetical protein FN846DRAFT_893410 [Sphaerosporella brunnea]|uniref:Uncharacterized protein n=1 Tax=Sphaerosporella brunnea TaxID=1250544 RepID=A0A5J5EM21_9PEZI|nr:hypothetical protein FN846DRAFT_893410 [Sphaerosporella brunnea]